MSGAIGTVFAQRDQKIQMIISDVSVETSDSTAKIRWTETPPLNCPSSARKREVSMPRAVWDQAKK